MTAPEVGNSEEDIEAYYLARMVLGPAEHLLISKPQYDALVNAREVLSDLTAIEEKFFAICEHYREIEEFIFRSTLADMMYSDFNAPSLHSVGGQFGRLVGAFLSAVRLYLDSFCTHAKAISGGAIDQDTAKALSAHEYDSNFCYRVMEAIRNHAQHRAFPVHRTTFKQNYDDKQNLHTYAVDFFFLIEEIEDGKFKAAIKSEIEATGKPVNLKACVRSYFASVCDIHEQCRKLFNEYRDKAYATIDGARKQWVDSFPNSPLLAVEAAKFKGEFVDKSADAVSISPQIEEYRQFLASKTRAMTNMIKRRVALY